MPSELLNANAAPRRDRSLVIAYWVLGVVALVEVITAAVGLAPKVAGNVRKSHASSPDTALAAESALISQQLSSSSSTPSSTPQTALAPSNSKTSKSAKTEEIPALAVDPNTDQQPPASDSAPPLDSTDRPFRQPPSNAASPEGAAIEILTADLKGTDDGSKTLQLAIKSRSHDPIDVPQVKVQVYFYDVQNDDIVPSKAQVTSRWLSAPVDWTGGKPELLEVRYLSDTADPDVHFAGYVVAIYYKDELQDCRATPPKLKKLFEPRYYLPPDEQQ
jgi:hypothetical protein